MRYGRSRSFKIIDTGTNRQPVCNFLSASNSNIGHIVYWLRDIATKVHKQPVLPNPLNAGARVITSELLCKIGLKNGVRGLTEGDSTLRSSLDSFSEKIKKIAEFTH